MIHPSTMAGPNWMTASFGQTNPLQQGPSPFFRSTPFGGQQGGFGFGINPFQSQQFGTNPMQVQHTVQEIVRQVLPTVLASSGIQPSSVFQTSFGQPGPFGSPTTMGFQTLTGSTPFGPQFQNPMLGLTDWQNQIQNPIVVQELIRQVTNQAIQTLVQQGLGQSQGFQGIGWQNPLQQFQQQQLPQLQQLAQLVGQVCQQVAATVIQSLTQLNQQQGQNIPFNLQSTPYNTSNITSQYGVTPGIPTGVGAF